MTEGDTFIRENTSTEYLQPFSYRIYSGEIGDRKRRIWSVIWFQQF